MILTVLKKELKDHFRDRRSLRASLVMPLLGPVVLLLLFNFMSSMNEERPLRLPVIGAAEAPNLILFLQERGVTVLTPEEALAPEDGAPDATPMPSSVEGQREALEAQVKEGTLAAFLEIDPSFPENFSAGRAASIRLSVDSSLNQARKNVHILSSLLQAYSGAQAAMRLMVRGIAPELATPVRVEEIDLATSEELSANLLNMVPLFLMLAAIVGGMNLAIDATAGERERGSLEPLLLNPISRLQLVVGKWLATAILSSGVVLLAELGFLGMLSYIPFEELGLKVAFALPQALVAALAVIPLAFFMSALQMLIATFARSFKEAQTYLNLLNLVPVVPAMVLMLNPVDDAAWMTLVPTIAQLNIITSLMRGEWVSSGALLLVALSSAIYTAICLLLLTRLLGRESIIFGQGGE